MGTAQSASLDPDSRSARSVPIITKGRFVGYLTSRETAPVLELDSTGAMRADGWRNMPLIRMTNVNLLPGADKKLTLEGLVASTDSGILMCTNRSWSIDNKRLIFQFGCEIGWEIENGKRERIVKNPTYTGTTPIFWTPLKMDVTVPLSCFQRASYETASPETENGIGGVCTLQPLGKA